MNTQQEISRIQVVKTKYEQMLLQKRHVVGVGIGLREVKGQVTKEVVLTVMVSEKLPRSQLHPRDLIPAVLDDVVVDVKKVGKIQIL